MSTTEEIDHISFSQLTKMAECGEMWRRAYVLEERGTPTVPMLAGSAIHHGIEMFELSGLGQAMTTGPEAAWKLRLPDAHDAIIAMAKAHIRKFLEMHALKPTDLIHYGRQTLAVFQSKKLPVFATNFLKRRFQDVQNRYTTPLDPVRECIERPLSVEIAGTRIIGQLDHLLADRTGAIVLRDYKTGARKMADAWQLEIYRWMIKHDLGIDAEYGQVEYLGNKPGTDIVRWKLEDEAVEEMLSRLVKQILHKNYSITGPFNGICQMCPYRGDCPWGGVGGRGVG